MDPQSLIAEAASVPIQDALHATSAGVQELFSCQRLIQHFAVHRCLTRSTYACPQGLYSCRPFRERLIQYAAAAGGAKAAEDNILTCLAELFLQVQVLYKLLTEATLLTEAGCFQSAREVGQPTQLVQHMSIERATDRGWVEGAGCRGNSFARH